MFILFIIIKIIGEQTIRTEKIEHAYFILVDSSTVMLEKYICHFRGVGSVLSFLFYDGKHRFSAVLLSYFTSEHHV